MSEKKIGLIVQARMNSTRLPNKVLRTFCEKPMLLYLIDRLRNEFSDFTNVNIIAVATSVNKKDEPIVKLCQQKKIPFIRGSEINVFSRFKLAIKEYKLDTIVRLTADNPIIELELIKKCINHHDNSKHNITSTRFIYNNRIKRFTVKGHSVDVINCRYMLSIIEKDLNDFDIEHVIPPFFKDRKKVNLISYTCANLEESTIDTITDFNRVSQLANEN